MNRILEPDGVAWWSTWAACAFSAAGAVVAIAAPYGGTNRIVGVAPALAFAGILLAAIALSWRRFPPLAAGIVYAAAVLAMLYGVIYALSLPLRLAVQGICPASTATCPVGYEHPATSGESFAVYATTVLAALALVTVFVAIEARYLRSSRPRREQTGPPPP